MPNTAEQSFDHSANGASHHAVAPSGADAFAFERSYIKHAQSNCGAYKFIELREIDAIVKLWRQQAPCADLVYGLSSEQHHELLRALKDRGISFRAESASQLDRLQILGSAPATISYTPSFPVGNALAAIRNVQPAVITVGSPEALQAIIGESATLREALGYDPTVNILVRSDDTQPYQAPQKVGELITLLREKGCTSFGLSVLVNEEEWSIASYQRAATALKVAASQAAEAGVQLESLHVLGGLCGMDTVHRDGGLCLEQYVEQLGQVLKDLKSEVCARFPDSNIKLVVEGGQLLVGHNPILSRVANVVPTSPGNPDFVFIQSHSYGDFARHMYGDAPVHVVAVQDPLASAPLATEALPFVVQGGSCDSVDIINDVKTGKPAHFPLPIDIKTGCYLALYGHRLDNGGMDFNLIPPAQVVVVQDKSMAVCGAVKTPEPFHKPFMDRRQQWAASEDAAYVRGYVTSFRDAHKKSAGISPTAEERRDRMKRAATALLKRFPDLRVPTTLLDVGEYIGRVQQVEHFLKWMPRFATPEAAAKWLAQPVFPRTERASGADRLFIPLKTLNDPVAVEVLSQLGHGYDAASAAEIAVAHGAGANPSQDVIVSHPHMTEETLAAVVVQRPWAVTVDCESQLDRLINAGLSRETIVFVRIKASTAEAVNDLSSKFGAAVSRSKQVDDATPLIRKAHEAGFPQIGIAFHVGTQCVDARSYRTALERCKWLTEKLSKDENPILIKHFNIGGGFSDERVAAAKRASQRRILTQTCVQVNAFRASVEKTVGERVYIIAEPGRVTCAAAAATLIPVVEVCNQQMSIPRIRLASHRQGHLSGNVHDAAYYELTSLDYVEGAQVYSGVNVLGVSGQSQDQFVPAPGTEHKITTSTKPGDWVISYESGGAYGVNAAGALNGIDPGGLIGFMEDPNEPDGFRFIVSPLFDVEGIKNAALRERLSRS